MASRELYQSRLEIGRLSNAAIASRAQTLIILVSIAALVVAPFNQLPGDMVLHRPVDRTLGTATIGRNKLQQRRHSLATRT